jgi:hypothetical protein
MKQQHRAVQRLDGLAVGTARDSGGRDGRASGDADVTADLGKCGTLPCYRYVYGDYVRRYAGSVMATHREEAGDDRFWRQTMYAAQQHPADHRQTARRERVARRRTSSLPILPVRGCTRSAAPG